MRWWIFFGIVVVLVLVTIVFFRANPTLWDELRGGPAKRRSREILREGTVSDETGITGVSAETFEAITYGEMVIVDTHDDPQLNLLGDQAETERAQLGIHADSPPVVHSEEEGGAPDRRSG